MNNYNRFQAAVDRFPMGDEFYNCACNRCGGSLFECRMCGAVTGYWFMMVMQKQTYHICSSICLKRWMALNLNNVMAYNHSRYNCETFRGGNLRERGHWRRPAQRHNTNPYFESSRFHLQESAKQPRLIIQHDIEHKAPPLPCQEHKVDPCKQQHLQKGVDQGKYGVMPKAKADEKHKQLEEASVEDLVMNNGGGDDDDDSWYNQSMERFHESKA